jgi:hypothetical protein
MAKSNGPTGSTREEFYRMLDGQVMGDDEHFVKRDLVLTTGHPPDGSNPNQRPTP